LFATANNWEEGAPTYRVAFISDMA
jgi:hypothetical protein